jgi:hypothetical protein
VLGRWIIFYLASKRSNPNDSYRSLPIAVLQFNLRICLRIIARLNLARLSSYLP